MRPAEVVCESMLTGSSILGVAMLNTESAGTQHQNGLILKATVSNMITMIIMDHHQPSLTSLTIIINCRGLAPRQVTELLARETWLWGKAGVAGVAVAHPALVTTGS